MQYKMHVSWYNEPKSSILSWDSVVGMAAGYVLDSQGFESWWTQETFSKSVQNSYGVHSTCCSVSTSILYWG